MGPLLGVILSATGIKRRNWSSAIKPLGLSATAAALFLTGVILSPVSADQHHAITSTIALLIQPLRLVSFNWSARLAGGLHYRHSDDCAARGLRRVCNRGVQSPDAEAVPLLSSASQYPVAAAAISLTSGM